MKKVLNVGGNSKDILLPPQYQGWEHVLLDIDSKGSPDVLCDARNMAGLPASEYDAVYCAHNLEHYYRHDVVRVLDGFRHVLKPEGFAHICVPDMGTLMRTVVERKLDIDDLLYKSSLGPITVRDVIYGHGGQIERSGNDFFAHKTGFTEKSLLLTLKARGFPWVFSRLANLEVQALAFKNRPGKHVIELFKLSSLNGQ